MVNDPESDDKSDEPREDHKVNCDPNFVNRFDVIARRNSHGPAKREIILRDEITV
jgi:hypothetical protein